MEGKVGQSKRKRPFFEDDFGDEGEHSKQSKQKKVRFPKGKKGKAGIDVQTVEDVADADSELFNSKDARHAAVERANRRNQLNAELFSGQVNDMSGAEISYEDSENLLEDGIQIEPFNLDKEREEGYFDREGNFVEFVNEDDFRDPWLESIDADQKFVEKGAKDLIRDGIDEEDAYVLTSEDIGNLKRRIADVLKPGETVLQALRRLKGNSDGKKHKMSSETQNIFDQLTEDANKLLEQGEYNVYHEKQEVFVREAEGYEKLRRARDTDEPSNGESGIDIFSEEPGSSILVNPTSGTLEQSKEVIAGDKSESYDIFADEDENPGSKVLDVNADMTSDSNNNGTVGDVVLDGSTEVTASDYMYDEASGYYYSSTSGYYYDSSTGFYCHATSGQWYSYNQENGTYEEISQNSSGTL